MASLEKNLATNLIPSSELILGLRKHLKWRHNISMFICTYSDFSIFSSFYLRWKVNNYIEHKEEMYNRQSPTLPFGWSQNMYELHTWDQQWVYILNIIKIL